MQVDDKYMSYDHGVLTFEMSGVGPKSTTLMTFNHAAQTPLQEDLNVFARVLETLTPGTVESARFKPVIDVDVEPTHIVQ